jgi:hypothetical protein
VGCPIRLSQAKWNKDEWDGKVLMIHSGAGQFGNQLFYAAATLAAAANYNRPILVLKSRLGWGLQELPCLQSTAGLDVALASGICKDFPESAVSGQVENECLDKLKTNHLIETPARGPPKLSQDLSLWGNDPESFFPVLREAFSVQSVVAALPEQPGPDDLVLYFRTYNGVNDTHIVNEWKGRHRLASPPVEFFKRAIERHQAISSGHRDGRIWVAASPDQRKHPTVQRLVREHHAVVYTASDNLSNPWLYDFAWLSAARHVAISPSTFGWWAAVIGDPKRVYFPIMPAAVPMPWCNLITKGDTLIYDDWWTGNAYNGGKNQTDALHACRKYESDGTDLTQQGRLRTFYPELE